MSAETERGRTASGASLDCQEATAQARHPENDGSAAARLNGTALAPEANSLLDVLSRLARAVLGPGDRPNVTELAADPPLDRITRRVASAVRAAAVTITIRGAAGIGRSVYGDLLPFQGATRPDTPVIEADAAVIHRDITDSGGTRRFGTARFYAGVPARDSQGEIVAVLTVFDSAPRPNWDAKDTALLKDAATDLERELGVRAALKETEEKYRSVYDSIPMGVYRQEPDGRVSMANRRMAEMLGFPGVSELLEAREFRFRRDEGESEFRTRLLAEGEIRGEEARWRRRDGSVIYVRHTAHAILTSAGEILHMEGAAEDITETVRAGEALRASETRFLAFMENFPGAATIKDRTGRRLYVNSTVRRLFHPRSDLEQGDIYPPDQSAKIRAHDETVFASNRPVQVIESLSIGDRRFDWLTLKFPFTGEGGEPRLGMIALDITERLQTARALRESEERLRLAQSIGGIETWEFNSLDEASHRGLAEWISRIHPDDRALVQEAIRRTHEGDESSVVEYRVVLPDGSIRWFRYVGKTVARDEKMNLLRSVGIQQDITAYREAEEALRKSRERLTIAQSVADIAAWEWDLATGALSFDEAAPKLLMGSLPSPASIDDWLARVFKCDRPDLNQTIQLMLQSDCEQSAEYRMVLPDGSLRWIHSIGKVVARDPSGAPLMAIGISQNTTSRRQSEEALRRSEERLKLAQTVAGIAAWEWVVPTGEFSTHAGLNGLGLGPMNMADWLGSIHPEDRPHVERTLSRGLESGEACSAEYRFVLDDGSARWLCSTGQLVDRDSDGKPLRVMGITQDIGQRRAQGQALRESEERFRAISHDSADVIVDCDIATRQLLTFPSRHLPPSVRTLDDIYALVHPDDRERVRNDREEIIREGGSIEQEYRSIIPAGQVVYRYHRGSVLRDATGKPYRYLGRSIDVTALKRAEEQAARLAALVQCSTDAIIALSLDGEIVSWNAGAELILLYKADAVEGRSFAALALPHERELFERVVKQVCKSESIKGHETSLLRQDGSQVDVSLSISPIIHESGERIGISVIARDITDRKRAERQLAHQAQHDILTGLPNRRALKNQLQREIAQARANSQMLALLYFDLDGFKLINDTFGHPTGDALLQAAAYRFKGHVRAGDTLARMGGDEFTVLLRDVETPEEAYLLAVRLLKCLEEPFSIGGSRLYVTASIGIGLYPIHAASEAELQKHADAAMYEAKRAGKNRINFYMPQIGVELRERLELGNDLRRAIERRELSLDYQPLFSLADRRVTGLEALLRWKHPQRGMVAPSKFIPIAEETGAILPIGDWVVEQVCRDIRAWAEEGRSPLRVAANVSAVQFIAKGFAEHIRDIVEKSGIAPGQLELELTESSVFANFEDALSKMRELRTLGIRFVLDDFGTGFSSLSYLQQLPIEALKIDRSFASGLGTSDESLRLLGGIVSLAHGLGLRVVLEGLETAVQLETASQAGCDEGQGFFLGRPGPGRQWLTGPEGNAAI